MEKKDIKKLIKLAKAHNQRISDFINIDLAAHFGGTKVSPMQWFEAQRLINEQHFYQTGMTILTALRDEGIDAKMNMQSNEIVLPYGM